MSLLFQHPALLGLLALAGLPVLVHLLSRARPPAYRFSNIEFLRRVLRSTARLRRPKDWLLLALRSLALFALAAAFTAPVLISKSASLPGEKSTVILLVDRSASMAAREGAGSRFEAACAQAARYLEQAKPDHANLIWIDAEPDAAFPEPGPNLTYLTDILKQVKPRPEAGALTAAFDLALRQLAKVGGHRELVIVSDFQASAWRDFAPSLPGNIVVRTQRVATSSPPNVTVSRLIPQPAEPVVGQDLTLLTRVQNFSAEPLRTQLTLDADGARQSRAIDLPAWGEAESAFVLRPATPGPMPISASVEADAFPADDARFAVVHVRDSLRLALTTAPDSADAKILGKLAKSLSWLEGVTDLTISQRPDYHFISAWSGDNPAALRQAALAGTTLILRPAAACPLAAIRSLLNVPANPVDGPLALDASPAGWSVIPEETHAANQLFRSGDFGNPFGGSFRERLHLPATLATLPNIRPIALFADGIPALLECPTTNASILLWNLPLDPSKTDWPTQGSFLPALAEILLRTRPRGAAESAYVLPGIPLTWSSTDPAHAGAISLLGPASEPIEITESATAGGTLWQAKSPATPGLFRWQISGQPIAFTAVNFPDSESDLRPLEATPAFGKLNASSDSLVRQAALAQGLPLWPWLALAGILFLVLESLVHARSR
ncbi:MAG: VWA domain-containing protein [Verrucomicrobiota bacterium]